MECGLDVFVVTSRIGKEYIGRGRVLQLGRILQTKTNKNFVSILKLNLELSRHDAKRIRSLPLTVFK